MRPPHLVKQLSKCWGESRYSVQILLSDIFSHGILLFFSPAALVEVADFQIKYSSSGNQTKKGVPRLVFRKNMTKIWVGGSTVPPKDRPACGFENELCPPSTEKPSGLFSMYF